MVTVKLSTDEYNYLIKLLQQNKSEIIDHVEFRTERRCLFRKPKIYATLDEDVAFDIREIASDEVGLHFDENYHPLPEALLLESFIDKFYVP